MIIAALAQQLPRLVRKSLFSRIGRAEFLNAAKICANRSKFSQSSLTLPKAIQLDL